MTRALDAVATAAAVALVAGCGGAATGVAAPPVQPAGTASTLMADQQPVCADRAVPVGLPAGFPRDFPLPPRAVVTGSEVRTGRRLVVTAVSPDDVKTVLIYLQSALPKAGLRLTEGEVEPHDAESNYEGPAYRGRWTLRDIPGCPADTVVTVLVAPRQ
ncbi:MAG: hypothetical protein ACYCV4_04270 [Dermatophilaceae bacterium]